MPVPWALPCDTLKAVLQAVDAQLTALGAALQGPNTPRGACTDKAGAAAAVLQPPTRDTADGRLQVACT